MPSSPGEAAGPRPRRRWLCFLKGHLTVLYMSLDPRDRAGEHVFEVFTVCTRCGKDGRGE